MSVKSLLASASVTNTSLDTYKDERPRPSVAAKSASDIILTVDPVMRSVLGQVEIASQTSSNVVIYGESGTGKELVAKALHELGPRAEGTFAAINCGAFTETLLESELFGHVKGAFTDARADKVGHIVRANGGTLFLDEIGDAPLSIQVKLLRVLQEREVVPVGSTTPVKIDVRVIAATHRDLKAMVAEGKFREDLFYRLQVLPLRIPALRERPDDISHLAHVFMARFCADAARSVKALSPDALAAIRSYAWPGNIRELQNRFEHAVVMGSKPSIEVSDLFPELKGSSIETLSAESATYDGSFQRPSADQAATIPTFKEAKENFERTYTENVLREARGNISEAARLAGKCRTEIYSLIKKFGLNPAAYKH